MTVLASAPADLSISKLAGARVRSMSGSPVVRMGWGGSDQHGEISVNGGLWKMKRYEVDGRLWYELFFWLPSAWVGVWWIG